MRSRCRLAGSRSISMYLSYSGPARSSEWAQKYLVEVAADAGLAIEAAALLEAAEGQEELGGLLLPTIAAVVALHTPRHQSQPIIEIRRMEPEEDGSHSSSSEDDLLDFEEFECNRVTQEVMKGSHQVPDDADYIRTER
jgi:hypothetical protein